MSGPREPALLRVEDLHVEAPGRPLVRGVGLDVAPGEAFGLVGESGSGKSLTARAVLRLLPRALRTRGRILFDGADVGAFTPAGLRRYRSGGVGMVFQDPRAHINPVRSVGDFLTEGLRTVGGASRRRAESEAVGLLEEVGVDAAPRRMRQWPHELSGGLLQRVMIASVLAARPRLILADEPTTALDATTQEEVMAILGDLRRERGAALLFITHDLDLAAAVCDRVGVMYAGRVVEELPARELERRPLHPYTAGLLRARPRIRGPRGRLEAVPGRPLPAYEAPDGCAFRDRCPRAAEVCAAAPPLRPLGAGRVACHFADEGAPGTDFGEDVGEDAGGGAPGEIGEEDRRG
ncbi:ABC transporter ATP-binding protein [Nocardiopsis sp. RSe5-2]|uniref:ABC transporter ATP-binding protein n=1 Tax=Nocardiopsis endophytica TaxID=3018445 RepID=A0ABT4U6S3_9ACTN|nr:ABC transporter ATP-binding protein [Nocardiopsis endophytica]MDA2812648.1 ABC transporter ATP-binding protein [Nocardiopsis endophytica]